MTDHSNPAPTSGDQAPAPRRRGRGWLFISTIALAAAITGGLTTRAVTQGSFAMPAAVVEDMYSPQVHARTNMGNVTIGAEK